jgi:large repetitive protein
VRATSAAITCKILRPIRWPVRRRLSHPRSVWFLLLATIIFLSPSRSFASVTISISPNAVNLSANGSQQFTATVTGASDTSVTWTIQEGSFGGTISNAGLYSAPGILGTYHVVATSNADSTQSATAIVVLAGFLRSGLLYSGACTVTLLPSGTILYTGGQPAGFSVGVNSGSNNAELYDPVAMTSTPTGNMTIPRCGETATLLPNGKVLFAGGQTLGAGTATAELFDPIAGTFASTGGMSVVRFGHTATLLPNGTVLIAGGENCNSGCVVSSSAELYDPSSGTFSLTGNNMSAAYSGAAAILLATGQALIAGGHSGGTTLNNFADLYNPATDLFTQAGAMVNPRQAFTATLLQNGKVLFAGGLSSSGGTVAAAEIFDPFTETFATAGSLNFPRELHTASLLPGGKVLIAGGGSAISRIAAAELYDPATGLFTLTGNLQETRVDPTATTLLNGSVVIAAGNAGQLLSSVETYVPSEGTFSSQSVFMRGTRTGHATTQLADGRVLLTGGRDAYFNVNSSAEIYDPVAGNFSLTSGPLNQARYGHTATLLNNGNVLLVGGYSDSLGTNPVTTAEIYNPGSDTFSVASSPNIPQAYHTATLLQNGMVVIAGGQTTGHQATASVELYDPVAGTFTPAGSMSAPRYNHTATLLKNGSVLIAEGIAGTIGGSGNQVAPDELYDPLTGTFTEVGPPAEFLQIPANPFDSVLLASGQVLVDEATIFDPNSNTLSTFNPLTTLSAQLQDYKFLLLPNDQVFVSGGQSAAYLFDPVLQAYSPAGTMEYSRSSPTVKLLSNGKVLIAGGANVTQAEFYVPPASASSTSPSPVLSLINPSSVVAGGTGFTLTVLGFNFVSNSAVNFNGVARQTTYQSATQLSISISSGDIANPGAANITVTNPSNSTSGGSTSNPATMTITAGNIQPVVGALSPASTTAGGPSFTLVLSGNNFTPSSVVSFNGNTIVSKFLSTAELQGTIPASAIAVAGTPIVTVANPGGAPSVVVTFTVNNPVPQAITISPTSAQPGGAAVPLDVTGTNFNASSIVLINGAALPTTYVNSSLLHATLPAGDLAQGGKLNVTVNNPAPGGGTTSALAFTIEDYAITGPTSAMTVSAGQSAVFSLTVAPVNETYTNSITLSALGSPADATPSFAPSATITPDAGSPLVTLTIATVSRTASAPADFPGGRRAMPLLCLAGIALTLLGIVKRNSGCGTQRLAPQFLWAFLLVAVAGLIACSGSVAGNSSPAQVNPVSGTGTPAGTYTITVTATSGSITHSTQVTLIVM